MKTVLFYQSKNLKKYFFNISLFLGLSLATMISCGDSNAGPTLELESKENLNTLQFTYNAVEYREGLTVTTTSSPTWIEALSSTGITYSIAVATNGNIPDQKYITNGAITIDSNTGVITVMTNVTLSNSGDYLVTATAGSDSVYAEESVQTATFSFTFIEATDPPGTPILRYALRIDGLFVKLTPNEDNPYGLYSDGSSPTFASYNFYYTPTSSFTGTPTPQEVKSNSIITNIPNISESTNIVISNLSQDTEYYIVVESVHASPSKTALSEIYTKRTASIRASDRADLCTTISAIIATNSTAELNHIDTSQVTDMRYLFNSDYDCRPSFSSEVRPQMYVFNGDMSSWDTSKVTTMISMFSYANTFNQDISDWDTANVTTMQNMFYYATSFNQDISDWDTSKVTTMQNMFNSATSFNQDISDWDTSKVTTMTYMFSFASAFNQDISDWDTANVITMEGMFQSAISFDQNISSWDTSKVTDMNNMFNRASAFNSDISGWNTSSVNNMGYMFNAASAFNQDISDWDTSKVTTMQNMFNSATSFNQNISNWNTSKVTTMTSMFLNAIVFNQDISDWDTSSVTDMISMFSKAKAFNQDISDWDTSSVTDMRSMFLDATAFNQDISGWNISNVTTMRFMFYYATALDQDFSNWDVTDIDAEVMFTGATSMQAGNYPQGYTP